MATKAVHGKRASIWVDGMNASPFLQEYEYESERDDTDVTPLESEDKEYIAGSAENTLTLTGFWNGDEDSLDELLDETFGGDEQNVITVCPGGVASGKACYLAAATQISYNVQGSSDDMNEAEAELRTARVRGRVAKIPGSASTFSTPLIAPAATSKGLTAHLHIRGISGAPTGLTMAVEGSTDGTTWAALGNAIVVDVANAKGGYVIKTDKTETIPVQLRVKPTFTAGTTPAVDYMGAIGRRA